MTHSNNISQYKIDTRAVARRLILSASIASVLGTSACGVKIGQGVVIGTTSFLEEANKGAFTSQFQEYKKANQEVGPKLSVRLEEVK